LASVHRVPPRGVNSFFITPGPSVHHLYLSPQDFSTRTLYWLFYCHSLVILFFVVALVRKTRPNR
jgi:hypothetical protein